ncbi:acylglycerone-phosphate reductase-like protein [Lasiosphaeria miniovina]|uniref:Acylglycerone-phosphate reductase-like protein n=1 Tax=Lasiosphaeria miniovina TaxID=1954250 RepID=A0AA40E1U5_9PEZI|nr:acylglycerone-phosphate reductase-like protein [Lasiosphaeria miniovina]KAK0721852.1 acylglycerone-phosphate reductase-like protein [Lasiosphaeria miniovina]
MPPRPEQKTVLITGCTPGGIGHALALEFHAKGLHVIATARNISVLAEMAEMGMTTLALDVTKAASIKECHDEVALLTGGRLDILINNAGRTHTIPATDLDIDDVRETFETNVFGVMAMCAAFADLLIQAGGLIINIASLAAITPYVFGSAYCASKGAVVSYSRTLRLELKPYGVRVMVAMAGTIRSQIASKTHRVLPPASIYQRVADMFQRRLTFSQNNATVPTDAFARKLVASALRPEWPVILRSWFGRPDWFYAGGWAGKVWFATSLGEWVLDTIMYRMFKLHNLERAIKQEQAAQKKLK